ncbi:glutathione S-transferase [Rhodanobacter sp. Root627]|uniref:glutathione S-transferase family protein n=1 Tax=Rhodanobacter sp. Root627 TaxID=1736572 RepID=UPI0006FE5E02|nr:glutathione S-transferase family protein [Rhodanobacter sp. Root627]KRA35799.1 glutathione S-transferase [Rhodanobacter sp. Root627]
MKLYWSNVTSPRKACVVAKYLQSPVEYAYVDLDRGEQKAPEYLALNPNGKVPTLVDGTRVLWESDAIMCHLAARSDSDLWPQDDRQIDVLRWLSWAGQEFNPVASQLYFEYIIKPRFNIGEPDVDAAGRAQEAFRQLAAILENHLQDRRWLVGKTLTVADFSLAITLPYAEAAHIPLAEFPAIRRWHDALCEIDAWREPFPEIAVAA